MVGQSNFDSEDSQLEAEEREAVVVVDNMIDIGVDCASPSPSERHV